MFPNLYAITFACGLNGYTPMESPVTTDYF